MRNSIFLKSERCKGCGICVAFCPKSVLQLDVLNHCEIVNADDCIGCGQCELRCPDYAIFVDKNSVVVTKEAK